MKQEKPIAALFDLDGVIFDTEPQYSIFWGAECAKYRPDIPDLAYQFKGQTLEHIFSAYFTDPAEALQSDKTVTAKTTKKGK